MDDNTITLMVIAFALLMIAPNACEFVRKLTSEE